MLFFANDSSVLLVVCYLKSRESVEHLPTESEITSDCDCIFGVNFQVRYSIRGIMCSVSFRFSARLGSYKQTYILLKAR